MVHQYSWYWVPLVSILSSKDMFDEHYRRMLAVRMLTYLLFHDDQYCISELKLHNGVQYVQKMEVMIGDMRRSAEDERMDRIAQEQIFAPRVRFPYLCK